MEFPRGARFTPPKRPAPPHVPCRCRAVRGALGDLVLNESRPLERLQVPGRGVLDNAVCGKSFFALIDRGLVRLALQPLLQ